MAAQANPGTFKIPGPEEAALAKLGDLVRLHFLVTDDGTAEEETCPRAERMWVEICELRQGGLFRGHLTNEPAVIRSLQPGDVIEFEWRHVAQVYIPLSDPRHPDFKKK